MIQSGYPRNTLIIRNEPVDCRMRRGISLMLESIRSVIFVLLVCWLVWLRSVAWKVFRIVPAEHRGTDGLQPVAQLTLTMLT
jgi:hypothetical protein